MRMPDTTITGGPAAGSTTADARASFALSPTERDSTFRCKLDNEADFIQSPLPETYPDLVPSEHTFQVKPVGAGREANDSDPTPESRARTVEPLLDLQTFEENNPDHAGYAGWFF